MLSDLLVTYMQTDPCSEISPTEFNWIYSQGSMGDHLWEEAILGSMSLLHKQGPDQIVHKNIYVMCPCLPFKLFFIYSRLCHIQTQLFKYTLCGVASKEWLEITLRPDSIKRSADGEL